LRRAAVAWLLCATPVLADPVLDFENTDFRASLAYNDTASSSSESDAQPDGQSLQFVNGNTPFDNQMSNPIDQRWGVANTQVPSSPGGNPVTVTFDFWRLDASAIQSDRALTVILGALNAQDMSPLSLTGPVEMDVALVDTFSGAPQTLLSGTHWAWQPTAALRASEYDLVVDLDSAWGDELFGLSPSDTVNGVRLSFSVAPEPTTLALLAMCGLLCCPRRRR
jgi:hypothetical protein